MDKFKSPRTPQSSEGGLPSIISHKSSTMSNVRNSSVLLHMDIQPLGPEVSRNHHTRLDNAMLLWEISFAEVLNKPSQAVSPQSVTDRKFLSVWESEGTSLTTSEVGSSVIFLPINLLAHSSVLSPELLVIPGTTRGILILVFQ